MGRYSTRTGENPHSSNEVQLSSLPWPIGSSGGHEGRFSRHPLSVSSSAGHCEKFWHGRFLNEINVWLVLPLKARLNETCLPPRWPLTLENDSFIPPWSVLFWRFRVIWQSPSSSIFHTLISSVLSSFSILIEIKQQSSIYETLAYLKSFLCISRKPPRNYTSIIMGCFTASTTIHMLMFPRFATVAPSFHSYRQIHVLPRSRATWLSSCLWVWLPLLMCRLCALLFKPYPAFCWQFTAIRSSPSSPIKHVQLQESRYSPRRKEICR